MRLYVAVSRWLIPALSFAAMHALAEDTCLDLRVLVEVRSASVWHTKGGFPGHIERTPPRFYLRQELSKSTTDRVGTDYSLTCSSTEVMQLERLKYSTNGALPPVDAFQCDGRVQSLTQSLTRSGQYAESAGTYDCAATLSNNGWTGCQQRPAWLEDRIRLYNSWGVFVANVTNLNDRVSITTTRFVPNSPPGTRSAVTTETWTLADEYTTEQFLADVRSELQNRLGSGSWVAGRATAALEMNPQFQRCATASATRFRFRLPHTDAGVSYRIAWVEVTRPAAGSIELRHRTESLRGTGGTSTGREHTLLPPASSGFVSVEQVQVTVVADTPLSPPVADLGLETEGGACCGAGAPGTHPSGVFIAIPVPGFGSLLLSSAQPGHHLASVSAWSFHGSGSGLEIIENAGTLRQIKTPHLLLDLTQPAAGRCEVRLYPGAGSKTQGLYRPPGSPHSTWVLETLAGGNQLRLQANEAGRVRTVLHSYDAGSNTWTVETDVLRHTRMIQLSGNSRIHTWITTSLDGTPLFKLRSVVTAFPWGDAVTEETVGEGNDARVARYTFDQGFPGGIAVATGNLLPLRRVERPDGSWEITEYLANDPLGRVARLRTPFASSTPADEPARSRETQFDYAPVLAGDNTLVRPFAPRTIIHRSLGAEIARTYAMYNTNESRRIDCPNPGAAPSDPANVVTWRRFYTDGLFAGRPRSELGSDGLLTTYAYQENGDQSTRIRFEGQAAADGTAVMLGTRTMEIFDSRSNPVSRMVHQVRGGAIAEALAHESWSLPDAWGRPARKTHELAGLFEEFGYGCCGPEWSSDTEGVVTSTFHDSAGRVSGSTRNGITGFTLLDALGRPWAERRTGTNNVTLHLGGTRFNTASATVARTNALGGVTTIVETLNASSQRVVTTTLPNQASRSEVYHRDRSLERLTGSAAAAARFEYSIESEGGHSRLVTREIKLDAQGADTPEWIKTYNDGLGRTYKVLHPGTPAAAYTRSYNNRGQIEKETDPDGVVTLYRYDTLGRLEYTILDHNRNGAPDFAGDDPIHRVTRDVVVRPDSTIVHRTQSWLWLTRGQDAPTLVETVDRSTDGRQTWTSSAGMTNHLLIEIDRAARTRTVIATGSNGARTVQLYRDGEIESETRVGADLAPVSQVSYRRDPHGRLWQRVDARNGATSWTYNAADLVESETTPQPSDSSVVLVTTHIYQPDLALARIIHPDRSESVLTYHPSGRLKSHAGPNGFPAEYAYDSQGRLKSLTTWSAFPTAGGRRTTSWNYHPERGWPVAKLYPDNTGPTADYTAAGRLKSFAWARKPAGSNSPTSQSHAYDPVGRLETTSYSDGTPGATRRYDRAGRLESVTRDGITANLRYAAHGPLESESWSGGFMDGLSVMRSYDRHGIRQGLTSRAGGATLQAIAESYDPALRLKSISEGGESAQYSYLANHDLLEQIIYRQNGALRMTTSRSYDRLNRLHSIQSGHGPSLAFEYSHNSLGQQTNRTHYDGSAWRYTYDEFGQLAGARRFWADGRAIPGWQFEYDHDDVGNRLAVRSGGDVNMQSMRSAAYSANVLNQYTSRTVPWVFDVTGTAHGQAAVTVNGIGASRVNEFFHSIVIVDNHNGPVSQPVTVQAAHAGVTHTRSGTVLVPRNPESFTHDPDGNLLADGLWTYAWNADNRLVRVESSTAVPASARRRLEFDYDWQGRRLRKRVSTWNGTAYQLAETRRFLYDGWNLVAELDDSPTPVATYAWGLDLSATRDQAGGVGGLLWMRPRGHPAHFAALDGNGNITAWINASTGTSAALYEHGPFGEELRIEPPVFPDPMRFSSRYTDPETKLVYYGYRYRHPGTGRWLARDPIGETDAPHPRRSIDHDPTNRFDVLEMQLGSHPADP